MSFSSLLCDWKCPTSIQLKFKIIISLRLWHVEFALLQVMMQLYWQKLSRYFNRHTSWNCGINMRSNTNSTCMGGQYWSITNFKRPSVWFQKLKNLTRMVHPFPENLLPRVKERQVGHPMVHIQNSKRRGKDEIKWMRHLILFPAPDIHCFSFTKVLQ